MSGSLSESGSGNPRMPYPIHSLHPATTQAPIASSRSTSTSTLVDGPGRRSPYSPPPPPTSNFKPETSNSPNSPTSLPLCHSPRHCLIKSVAEPTQGGASDFPPTLWTVVRRGGAGSDEALESLCIAYREPLVAFIRRNWSDPQDAEDLTHGFIAELIRRNDLAHLAPDRGRFRSAVLKMESAWSLDYKSAFAASPTFGFMKDADRDALGDAFNKYAWWKDAKAAAKGAMPGGTMLFHYHPVVLLLAMAYAP